VHEVGGYAVDPAELQRGDALLSATATHARAGLAQLRECAAEVLGTSWQGAAAAAFRLGWEHWLDGVTAMLDALDEMAAWLGSSGVGYAETDDAVRAAIAGALT
jgi:WXG100 family type VII secretion target